MKKIFELEWNDDLGKDWMNIFNLELCLYGSHHTKRELITVKEVGTKDELSGIPSV